MKKIIFFTLISFLLGIHSQKCFAERTIFNLEEETKILFDFTSKYDLDAAEQFLDIAGKLKNGEKIEETKWEEIFNTTGYTKYFNLPDKESYQKWFREGMIAVFDQKNKNTLDSLLSIPITPDSPFLIDLVHNLYRTNQNLSKSQDFIKKTDFNKLMNEALEKTKIYIPEADKNITLEEIYTIYFLGRTGDVSVRAKTMFADLNYVSELDEYEFVNLFAHEFHHNFRGLKEIKTWHDHLLFTIDKMNIEGIADLIDKESPTSPQFTGFISNAPELDTIYISEYTSTPQKLEKIDSLFHSSLKTNDKEIYNSISKEIVFGGHPNGFYMATLIKEQLGLQKAIEVYADPVGFVRLYNEAAKKNGKEYVFSEAFMNHLETIDPLKNN